MNRGALPKIALLALIWGSGFLWIKLADRGFSAVEVTLARLALGAAVLFAAMLARRDKVPRSPRLWAAIIIAALFANAVPYLLFAVAERIIGVSQNPSSTQIRRAARIPDLVHANHARNLRLRHVFGDEVAGHQLRRELLKRRCGNVRRDLFYVWDEVV